MLSTIFTFYTVFVSFILFLWCKCGIYSFNKCENENNVLFTLCKLMLSAYVSTLIQQKIKFLRILNISTIYDLTIFAGMH